MPLMPSKGALCAHCTQYVLERAIPIARLYTHAVIRLSRVCAARPCKLSVCAHTTRHRGAPRHQESTNHPPQPMYARQTVATLLYRNQSRMWFSKSHFLALCRHYAHVHARILNLNRTFPLPILCRSSAHLSRCPRACPSLSVERF